MLKLFVVLVAGLVPFTPAIVYYLGKRFSAPDRATRGSYPRFRASISSSP